MTLTTRLSLFFLAALAAVLVTFSVALYLLADRHLHRQLDDRLAVSARTVSAAGVEPDGVEWEPHNRPLTLAPGAMGDQLHWIVTDERGRSSTARPNRVRQSFWPKRIAGSVTSREVIDDAQAGKLDAPNGTAREPAEALGEVGAAELATPIERTHGSPAAWGATVGGTQVHSVRLPGRCSGCHTSG